MGLIGIIKAKAMRQKIIISVIIYITGIVLTLISFIPLRPDMQFSNSVGFFGIVLLVASLVFGVIGLTKEKKIVKGKMISSRLTPLYKIYIPIFIVILFIVNNLLILLDSYPSNDISVFFAMEIILIIWLVLFLPCVKLHDVYLENNQIITINFFNRAVLKVTDIKKIRRFLIFFYKIKLDKMAGSHTIVMLPKLTESTNLFTTPKSIKVLKNLIKQ